MKRPGREPMNRTRSAEVEAFYRSWAWRKCRKDFAKFKNNLCERCLKKGRINAGEPGRPLEAHHKIPLTAANVHDPKVALNWANLELLCKDCHEEQKQRKQKRWRVDAEGNVTI